LSLLFEHLGTVTLIVASANLLHVQRVARPAYVAPVSEQVGTNVEGSKNTTTPPADIRAGQNWVSYSIGGCLRRGPESNILHIVHIHFSI